MEVPDSNARKYPGTCISVEFQGTSKGVANYRAEFRSWFWFMTRSTNNKVYQEMSAIDIFEKVIKDIGYDGEIRKKLSAVYPSREYTVQYRESDFDFVNRLLEEEGAYYFFEEANGKDVLIVADGEQEHEAIDGDAAIVYRDYDDKNERQFQHIYDWRQKAAATTGIVSLREYNFEKPKADLEVSKSILQGAHVHKDLELYDYPGHYRESADGERLAKIRMEAEAIRHKVITATSNVAAMAAGRFFELTEHPRAEENGEYIIKRAVHQFDLSEDQHARSTGKFRDRSLDWEGSGLERHRVTIEAIPKEEQYRPPAVTKWPEISGVHTAVVVGPSGEEIYTDEHGRIKVQFHWDRKGENDEKSSLWVRCMMPWTGEGWGMIHIPRIGQEVVIQFEEGNPDRPLVVGMLYNADKMPPYKLPDNQTQSGFTTRSTKSGNPDTFHELMFEDKKDEELVRFQSERDYKQIIKNDAEIEIGLEHKDKGDLKQTIHRNKTETLKTGELTQTIHTNKTVTLETGDLKTEVKDGNEDRIIKKNKTEEIGKNYELTVKGNQTDKITKTLKVSANQKIELKCGGSKITMEPAKITIQSVQVEIKGSAQTKVNGGAMLDLSSGGLIKAGAPLIKLN